VQVNADFTWETVLGEKKEKVKADENSDEKKTNDEVKSRKKSKKTKSQNLLPSTIDESKITDSTEKEEEPPFTFSDLRFEVPKGAFVAIVGRVGCGKVSRGVNCP
jgi:ATP-binding cassette, subfamily C (CFTR/MRP), member 1